MSLVFFDVTGSLASFSKIYLPNAQTSKTLASLSAALLCEDAAPWTRSPFPRRQPSHSHPAEMLYVVLLPFHRAGCYKDVITGQDLSEITMVSALLKTSLQKQTQNLSELWVCGWGDDNGASMFWCHCLNSHPGTSRPCHHCFCTVGTKIQSMKQQIRFWHCYQNSFDLADPLQKFSGTNCQDSANHTETHYAPYKVKNKQVQYIYKNNTKGKKEKVMDWMLAPTAPRFIYVLKP